MKIFLDSSSLIKLYHSEKGTTLLDKIFVDFVVNEIEKNKWLKENLNISFEEVIMAIADHQIKEFTNTPTRVNIRVRKFMKLE